MHEDFLAECSITEPHRDRSPHPPLSALLMERDRKSPAWARTMRDVGNMRCRNGTASPAEAMEKLAIPVVVRKSMSQRTHRMSGGIRRMLLDSRAN